MHRESDRTSYEKNKASTVQETSPLLFIGQGELRQEDLQSIIAVSEQKGLVVPLEETEADIKEILIRAERLAAAPWNEDELDRVEFNIVYDRNLVSGKYQVAGWIHEGHKRQSSKAVVYINGYTWSTLERSQKTVLISALALQAQATDELRQMTRRKSEKGPVDEKIKQINSEASDFIERFNRTNITIKESYRLQLARIVSFEDLEKIIERKAPEHRSTYSLLQEELFWELDTEAVNELKRAIGYFSEKNPESGIRFVGFCLKLFEDHSIDPKLVTVLAKQVASRAGQSDEDAALLWLENVVSMLPGITSAQSANVSAFLGTLCASSRAGFFEGATYYIRGFEEARGQKGSLGCEKWVCAFVRALNSSGKAQWSSTPPRAAITFDMLASLGLFEGGTTSSFLKKIASDNTAKAWQDIENLIGDRKAPLSAAVIKQLASYFYSTPDTILREKGLLPLVEQALINLASTKKQKRSDSVELLTRVIQSNHPTLLPFLEAELRRGVRGEIFTGARSTNSAIGGICAVFLGEVLKLEAHQSNSWEDGICVNLHRHAESLATLDAALRENGNWLHATAVYETLRRVGIDRNPPACVWTSRYASSKREEDSLEILEAFHNSTRLRQSLLQIVERLGKSELEVLQRLSYTGALQSNFGSIPNVPELIHGVINPNGENLKQTIRGILKLRTVHLSEAIEKDDQARLETTARWPIEANFAEPLIDFRLSTERGSIVSLNWLQSRGGTLELLLAPPQDLNWISRKAPKKFSKAGFTQLRALPPHANGSKKELGQGEPIDSALPVISQEEVPGDLLSVASDLNGVKFEHLMEQRRFIAEARGTFSDAYDLAKRVERLQREECIEEDLGTSLVLHMRRSDIVVLHGRDQLEELRKEENLIAKRKEARSFVLDSISFERGFSLLQQLVEAKTGKQVYSMKELAVHLPDITVYDVLAISLLDRPPTLYYTQVEATIGENLNIRPVRMPLKNIYTVGPYDMTSEGLMFATDCVTDAERDGGPALESDPYHYLGLTGVREFEEYISFDSPIQQAVESWIFLSISDKDIFRTLWFRHPETAQRGKTLMEAAAYELGGEEVDPEAWTIKRLTNKQIDNPVQGEQSTPLRLLRLIGMLEYVPRVLSQEEAFTGYVMPFGKQLNFIDAASGSIVESVPYVKYLQQRADEDLIAIVKDISPQNEIVKRVWNVIDKELEKRANDILANSDLCAKFSSHTRRQFEEVQTSFARLEDASNRQQDFSVNLSELIKAVKGLWESVSDVIVDNDVPASLKEPWRRLLQEADAAGRFFDNILDAGEKIDQEILNQAKSLITDLEIAVKDAEDVLNLYSPIDSMVWDLKDLYGIQVEHHVKTAFSEATASDFIHRYTNAHIDVKHTYKISQSELRDISVALSWIPSHLLKGNNIQRLQKRQKYDQFDLSSYGRMGSIGGQWFKQQNLIAYYSENGEYKLLEENKIQRLRETIIHEALHDIVDRLLTEEELTRWSGISWYLENGLWKRRLEAVVDREADESEKEFHRSDIIQEPSPEHFLNSYAGSSDPLEDLVVHATLYLTHGKEFEEQARTCEALRRKMEMLKELLFSVQENGSLQVIPPQTRTHFRVEETEGKIQEMMKELTAEQAVLSLREIDKSHAWKSDKARENVASYVDSVEDLLDKPIRPDEGEYEVPEDLGEESKDLWAKKRREIRERAYLSLASTIEHVLTESFGITLASDDENSSSECLFADDVVELIKHIINADFDAARDFLEKHFHLGREKRDTFIREVLESSGSFEDLWHEDRNRIHMAVTAFKEWLKEGGLKHESEEGDAFDEEKPFWSTEDEEDENEDDDEGLEAFYDAEEEGSYEECDAEDDFGIFDDDSDND